MAKEQDYTVNRIGFTWMINTALRTNNEPVYKQVKNTEVSLAETMGWRPYVKGQAPSEAKAYNPELAKALEQQRAAREKEEMTRLQSRIELVVSLGGMPDVAALKTASEEDFQAAIEELKESKQAEPKKAGRPKNV